MYRIRIDVVNDLNSDQIIELCDSEGHVIVFHELPHGNPHYHMFLQSQISDKALRQRFKRKFNLKASDYSVKKCDPDRVNEYVQYMFNTKHGNKWELIDTFNFDDKLLDDLIQAAKEVSDNYAESTKKYKGPTIWDIAQEVSQIIDDDIRCITTGNQPIYFFTQQYIDDQEYRIKVYSEVSIQILRKYKKPFDEFLLRKVITTAMSTWESGKKILIRKMYKNFCEYY